jgi:pyrimidine deaminase RibD-like protein
LQESKLKTLKTVVAVAVGALALSLNGAPGAEFGFNQAAAQESVRKEVGTPLTEASRLVKAGKFKDALGKLRDAEAVGGRTAAENNAIEGVRFSAAMGANEPDTMARSFEVLKGAGKLSQAQQLQYMEAIAGTYLRNKDNGKALTWSQRYFKEGGSSATMKQVQQNAQFLSGDMTSTIKDTLDELAADERAGRTPAKDKLNLLLFAAQKKGDAHAESVATEKLLNFYPDPKLWAQILGSLPQKKSFDSSRYALDLYRLRLATGNMSRGAEDYMEMAQLAAQAGYPEEGKQVVDKGMAAGVLGQGAEGARHKRLADLMVKKIGEAKANAAANEKAAEDAKDGNAFVTLGLANAFGGNAKKGITQIEQGIAKGNLKRPEDAKLYLGLAYQLAGESAKAQAAWKSVKGNEGAADLARLWVIQSRSAKR